MFADNTKIYSVIRNFDDCLRLQKDLDQLSQWSRIWLLQFNAAKCKIMRIGNSVPVTYSMEDSVNNIYTNLEAVDQEKDLGVWCTSGLKPSVQCQKATAKASQVLGTIRKSFKINSASMLVFLYKMYVRP